MDYGSLCENDDEIILHLERLLACRSSNSWETVHVRKLFKASHKGKSIVLTINSINAMFFQTHKDRLASAIRDHGTAVALEIKQNHDDKQINPAAVNAMADLHKALQLPIHCDHGSSYAI